MARKITSALIVCVMMLSLGVTVYAVPSIESHVSVNGYDPEADYMAEIHKCLNDGSPYAMQMGMVYERQRNLKISKQGNKLQKTSYFSTYATAEEIKEAIKRDTQPVPSYTEEDLYWLARVIYAEAGCDWFPDWVQRAVGSVVLNRAKSIQYPNSIKEVLWQPGQYGCVSSGSIYRTPTQKCINNARYILEHGSTLPSGVLGQSGYPTGPVHSSYYDSILGTTIYFFYV